MNPGGDVEAWRNFLLLLSRSPEAVRAEGGIARLWTTMAGRHVQLREIDYAQVLRERALGISAGWDSIISNCLQGDVFDLDDEALRELLAAADQAEKLVELIEALEARGLESGRGIGARTSALLRLLNGIVDAVTKREPDQLDHVMGSLATAIGRLSPDMMVRSKVVMACAVRSMVMSSVPKAVVNNVR